MKKDNPRDFSRPGWRLKGGRPVKHTEEFVINELQSFLDRLIEDDTLIYKGQLFKEKEYTFRKFSEWATKFKSCQVIQEGLKKIDEILETRAVERGMDAKGNVAFLIFFLKNCYDWKDKREHTFIKDVNLDNIKDSSNEELEKLATSITKESSSRVSKEGAGEKKTE